MGGALSRLFDNGQLANQIARLQEVVVKIYLEFKLVRILRDERKECKYFEV